MKDREYWIWSSDHGYDGGGTVSDTLWSSHDLAFKAAMKELDLKSIDFVPDEWATGVDGVHVYKKGSVYSGTFITIRRMKVGK